MEEKIQFKAGQTMLEGRLCLEGESRAVVVTHPHPLYGGDIYNPVVEAITQAFHEKGYSTLRFNFRGTGRSSGHFENGIGEQEDILGAMDCLREKGVSSVEVAGYSFGSWVAALLARRDPSIRITVMIAPPPAFLMFPEPLDLPHLKLVVTGSEDEFAPPDRVRSMTAKWNKTAACEILHGADHFYFGFLAELKDIIRKCI